jgi:phage gp46-like protein
MTTATLRIREQEACEEQPFLAWDSDWVQGELSAEGGFADWALASPSETGNAGGLKATASLHTGIIICLFTDKRAPDYLDTGDDDPRGWWGDSVDVMAELYEREVGSLIWTVVERGTLSKEKALTVKDMAIDSLQVIIDQGAVARFNVETEAILEESRLEMLVEAFAQDGKKIYEQRFENIWRQVAQMAA